jgi:aspartyl-tRNA(Asn)/glutamyl-tRNA(Gln) amidotransferase subunit A
MNPLKMTASELSIAYRAKAISPVEVAQTILSAIPDYEALNAFCFIDQDSVLSQAKQSEIRMNKGALLSDLDGVPIGIKDLILTRGMPTRRGSLTTSADGPWDDDAPSVARLREAGATILAKTTTPEMGWKGVTDSPLTGITRNPWDTTKTPGGSSGGGAVQVACGLGPISIGTDGGGSIRIPASFSGVFGFKPSYGRVPIWPASQVGTLANTGPLTRNVRDAAMTMQVISGWDARDWSSLPHQEIAWTEFPENYLKGKRIAYSPDLGLSKVNPEVGEKVRQAVQHMASLGAYVEEVQPPIGNMSEIIAVLWQSGCAHGQQKMSEHELSLLEPALREAGDQGRTYTLTHYMNAVDARNAFGARMRSFHAEWDFLVLPTMPDVAFEVGILGPRMPDGQINRAWNPFCYLFNLTMQPAASVPCGFTTNGLPIGLQLVGRMHDDLSVLRASAAIESLVSPMTFPSPPRAK